MTATGSHYDFNSLRGAPHWFAMTCGFRFYSVKQNDTERCPMV